MQAVPSRSNYPTGVRKLYIKTTIAYCTANKKLGDEAHHVHSDEIIALISAEANDNLQNKQITRNDNQH